MIGWVLNVQLTWRPLIVRYSKLTVMRGVEHTVSLFFNDVLKTPIVYKMISSHSMINNISGSGIYHKPYSIFKSKPQKFHNKDIGVFSMNDTTMTCKRGNFFNTLYCPQNLSIFLQIMFWQNSEVYLW